ncbi:capsid and scaffold protein [Shewanella phage Thanatos-2]|nr:capsid and scaffold protein [Shewanella phage Thanatos-2]
MIIVEAISNEQANSYESLLPEAEATLKTLSVLSKEEQMGLCERLAESDPGLAIAMGSIVADMPLNEFIVKHVTSKGEVTRKKDIKTRQRNAFQTTGLSKAKRRAIARKASKTKRANPSVQTRALRKRKIALRKRKTMGLD